MHRYDPISARLGWRNGQTLPLVFALRLDMHRRPTSGLTRVLEAARLGLRMLSRDPRPVTIPARISARELGLGTGWRLMCGYSSKLLDSTFSQLAIAKRVPARARAGPGTLHTPSESDFEELPENGDTRAVCVGVGGGGGASPRRPRRPEGDYVGINVILGYCEIIGDSLG